MLVMHAFLLSWNPGREPSKDSCAGWCRYNDENCVSPFKAAQCQGCDQCKALKAAAAALPVEPRDHFGQVRPVLQSTGRSPAPLRAAPALKQIHSADH